MSDSEYFDFYGIRALNGVDVLGIAANNSKLKEMKALLAGGVAINGIAVYSKRTALCSAASEGATRSVTLLLENGADVNLPDGNDMMALMYACRYGKKKGLLDRIHRLVSGPVRIFLVEDT
jgi:ankyrin repeat protein